MRTSTYARASAIVTASALAFSLNTGPASAGESDTATGKVVDTTAATSRLGSTSGLSAAGVITQIRLASGVITKRETTQFVGIVTGTPAQGEVSAQIDVSIDGTPKGRVPLYPGQGNGGVEIPRVWGSGKVQLGTTYFLDANGVVRSASASPSNQFYARKQVTSTRSNGIALRIKRRNSAVTFRALQVKIINPKSGRFQSVKRVKLQQLKGSRWKTIKTVKLNSQGNGSYKTSIRKKYRYRLYIPRSATQETFETLKTGKI